MLPFLELDSSPGSRCWHIGCTLLPVGYVLLLVDSFFDLRWVFFPSPKSKRALITYYQTILTPRTLYPGYWYPFYVIYKLCFQCPTPYHYATLCLFGPIAYRYRGLIRGTDRSLKYWWSIIILRVLLAFVTTWNIQSLNCGGLSDYGIRARQFFAWGR